MADSITKAEYELGHPERVDGLTPFWEWMSKAMRGELGEEIQQKWTASLGDNREVLKKAWGAPDFTWIDSDRRRNHVYARRLERGVTIFIFTAKDRGTSFEFTCPRGTKWSEDKEERKKEAEILSNMFIKFMTEKLYPLLPSKPKGT